MTAPPYRLAIVGGGPRATYALERLSATRDRLGHDGRLEVRLFERCGQFGAGEAHSPAQPRTSYLNRTTNQVGFAADESVDGAKPLRAPVARPTLYEWCRRKFVETGHPDFDLGPQDWPKRYVHGLALQDMFEAYVRDLRADRRLAVYLHDTEVVDVVRGPDQLWVQTAAGDSYAADEVLLLTGHVRHDPLRSPVTGPRAEFARATGAAYVPYPYPLDQTLPPALTAGVVGCAGMGLTAIDLVLHLTEGRGGRFVDDPAGGLTYQASGREPTSIVAFSGAGVFTFARPDNRKEDQPENAEHRGVFLTFAAIDRLRAGRGVPAAAGGAWLQLDFDRDVLPLLVLEMAYVHYATLFGPAVADVLAARVRPAYEAFLDGRDHRDESEPDQLAALLEPTIDEVAMSLQAALTGTNPPPASSTAPWPVQRTLDRWLAVVFGTSAGAQPLRVDLPAAPSPWRLDADPAGNRFSWHRTIKPVSGNGSPEAYRAAVLAFMDSDQRWAEQGNLDNPHKAAADGVWRDLRPVICSAIDDAGLTAASQRAFDASHVRHHNRLSNGAAPEVMAKIRALIAHGLIDVGAGPGACVTTDAASGRFVVHGPLTGASLPVDTLVEAWLPGFDPRLDASPLYRNLVAAGTVRLWRNAASDGGPDYEPGGLEVTAAFHPVAGDGTVELRLSILGPPTEGSRSFLLSALRPGRDHYVMRDTIVWLEEFWRSFEGRTVPCSTPSQACPSATARR